MGDPQPAPSAPTGPDAGSGRAGAPGGAVTGPDGRPRCPWALSAPEYVSYHDDEWGRPVRDRAGLFERLSLEAFQSGLSWLTVLRKRDAFRVAFADFDPVAIAAFGPADVERLVADAGIIRNRRKILATITNARALLALDGSFEELIWSFRPVTTAVPLVTTDLPAATAESAALARELKSHGFVFVGPTTAYALMQACGLVNDHLAACAVRSLGG
ncbi:MULTISPECIES: DNA-3-methyladenine glycosylase I [Protofrankia]|uniref:DNA-3-methyladenine glycosylase I n=1 Tax=Candidatus Protofrankia datiscae TaxID=2716812 RepID=F8AY11_9ACTN|nr:MULTISPECIES: DNA-3-methyladenine glycosylase I [Protofrankia]AEH08510.1 DNA-3-methyladenine glycosylase I [Candidatus Protofrankia datiscae]